MNNRRLILFSLLIVAAWLAFFGDKTPNGGPVADVVQSTTTRENNKTGPGLSARGPAETRTLASPPFGKVASTLQVAALIPREQLIPVDAEDREDRDLFPSLSWTPPPPKPEILATPLPPMAPPVPFVYLGKKLEGDLWEVYLGRGEQVFIVREGMTLDGTYQVKGINPPTLTLVYLPLKQAQTIPIGGSQW